VGTFQVVLTTAGGVIVAPLGMSGREDWSLVANGLLVVGFLFGPSVLGGWAWGTCPRPTVVAGVGVVLAALFVTPTLLIGFSGGWATTVIGSQVGWVLATATAAIGSTVLRRKHVVTAEVTG
jgi:hypothetical protein